jgi:hypothetical protein
VSAATSAPAAAREQAGVRRPEPWELAWIAALPCALLALVALVLLGPPLGHLLLMPRRGVLWPTIEALPQPEQHGRFLVGLIGPLLLAAVVLAQPRLRLALRPAMIRRWVLASQLALLALLLASFAATNNVVLSADFLGWPHRAYFSWATLLVALLLAPVALAALRHHGELTGWFARAARETPARRLVGAALAALYTAVWLTTAINLDSSIGNTIEAVSGHILWTMDEPFALLNGLTPLVDFRAQYGQVWAYVAAVPMALFGATIGTYTFVMAAGSGLAAFAVYAIFRRLVRSSIVALALYAPFLATAWFTIVGPFSDRFGPQNVYILWPIRFAGPVLLTWLTARHLDGAAPRRAWIVFAVAGLVAVNNPDFGLAAGLATFVALALITRRDRRGVARLAGEAAAGGAAGVALFALLTLVRSGSLPHVGLLFEYSRLYAIDGWEQLPMPELGLYLPLFLTFVAALIVALVRLVRGASDTLLTGLLAWIGVFGTAGSVYYAGRAFSMTLFVFFAPWAFAVVLLLLVVVPALAARAWRRPTLPELAVLFAFGLVVCSLPQTPAPWTQIARIRDRTPQPVFRQLEAERLVAATARRGEKVGILTALSHRVAYDTGVVNVSPFASIESIATHEQLRDAIAVFRREGVEKLYMSVRFTRPEEWSELQRAGYVIERFDDARLYALMIDRGGR